MKLLFKITLGVLLISINSQSFAEFEVSPSITVSSEKKVSTNSDIPLPSQAKPAVRKKLANASTRNKTKEFSGNKNQLLRCWQYGELIVAENGLSAPGPTGQKILSKGGKQLTGFDFGETFCLHMGN